MPVQSHLAEPLAAWLRPFLADLTRPPTWCHALTLVAGAVLAPGRRTVAARRRVTGLGLGQLPTFTNSHRVLNRNRWSSRAAAKRLLHRLLGTFAPKGPVVIGLDETIERRGGPRIKARGLDRDRSAAPAAATSSRPAACAGSLSCRPPRFPGPAGPGLGLAVPDRAGSFGALGA